MKKNRIFHLNDHENDLENELFVSSSNEDDSLSSTGNINMENKNGEDGAFQRTVVGTTPTPTIKPLPSPTMAN